MRHDYKPLKDKILGPFFAQDSTRTKGSFIMATKELGGSVYSFNASTSSLNKNESVFYTVEMFQAHHVDAIAMRHPKDGSVQWAADFAKVPIINAGDGKNQHPTQSLLDLFTIYSLNNNSLDNLKIGLAGDLKYGRTVHSLPIALSKFDNVELHIGAPHMLMMPGYMIKNLGDRGIKVVMHDNLEDVLRSSEIHYHTRPQFNLMKNDPNAPNEDEIMRQINQWRITLNMANSVGIENLPYILHPLPIDSKVSEIDFEITMLPKQKYLMQAESGVFMRKALLNEILSGTNYAVFDDNQTGIMQLYGQNHIQMPRSNDGKRKIDVNPGHVNPIRNGVVVDRIQYNRLNDVTKELDLSNKGINSISSNDAYSKDDNERKGLLFINEHYLNDKQMKMISLISPGATFNIIKDGRIVEKFAYAICENENCISNMPTEDVPNRFEQGYSGQAQCHYCGTPNDFLYKKLDDNSKQDFIRHLPKR
jgi:aspartate carbamoyltransferase catalytic subunit